MNILGITLARGGSKSIRLKNIKKLNNKPLINYSIEEALKSKFLTEYIVSTDHTEIAKVAKKAGAKIPFLRPKVYSNDTASSVSALQHAVKFMENELKVRYEFIVEIMCTNPLKTVKDIDSCIKKIIEKVITWL